MTPLPPSQLAHHDMPTFSMPTSKPICTLHHQLIGITADTAVDHDDNNFQNRLHWCPGAMPTSHRLEAIPHILEVHTLNNIVQYQEYVRENGPISATTSLLALATC